MYLDSFEQGPLALGNALAEMGDLPGAIGSFNEAIRRADADTTTHFMHFGMALLHGWRGQGAPHCYLGLALLKTGNPAGAIAELREAVRLEPESRVERCCLPVVPCPGQEGRPSGAIAVLRDALRNGPAGLPNAIQLLAPIILADRIEDTITILQRLRKQAGRRAGGRRLDRPCACPRQANLGARPTAAEDLSRRASIDPQLRCDLR